MSEQPEQSLEEKKENQSGMMVDPTLLSGPVLDDNPTEMKLNDVVNFDTIEYWYHDSPLLQYLLDNWITLLWYNWKTIKIILSIKLLLDITDLFQVIVLFLIHYNILKLKIKDE